MEFQKAIKKLLGIINLVSKNNNDDVINVLEKHESMVLKKEDIAAFKINWNEKSKYSRTFKRLIFRFR